VDSARRPARPAWIANPQIHLGPIVKGRLAGC
jgi:hypothetical protein